VGEKKSQQTNGRRREEQTFRDSKSKLEHHKGAGERERTTAREENLKDLRIAFRNPMKRDVDERA